MLSWLNRRYSCQFQASERTNMKELHAWRDLKESRMGSVRHGTISNPTLIANNQLSSHDWGSHIRQSCGQHKSCQWKTANSSWCLAVCFKKQWYLNTTFWNCFIWTHTRGKQAFMVLFEHPEYWEWFQGFIHWFFTATLSSKIVNHIHMSHVHKRLCHLFGRRDLARSGSLKSK